MKKGDLILLQSSSYVSQIGKPGYREERYELCRVASASRDGDKVKALTDLRYGTVQKFTGRSELNMRQVTRIRQDAAEKLVADRALWTNWDKYRFDSVEDFNKAMEPFVIEAQLAINAAKAAKPTKPGKYKMQYKPSKWVKAPTFTDKDYERQAVAYAEWLAARDGIEIAGPGLVNWGGVYIDHDQRSGKKLDKLRYEQRARSVAFYAITRKEYEDENRFYPREDKTVTIEIPNWDFVITPPVEEVDNDLPLAA